MSFNKLTTTDTATLTKSILSVERAAQLLPGYRRDLEQALTILRTLREVLHEDFNKPQSNIKEEHAWCQRHTGLVEIFEFDTVSVEAKRADNTVVVGLITLNNEGFALKKEHTLAKDGAKVVSEIDWF